MIQIIDKFKYVFALVLLASTIVMQSIPASASIHMPRYMSSVPAAATPGALGEDIKNSVTDIVQAGRYMFYGGYFTSATSHGVAKPFSCASLIVQDLVTKRASCPVRFNGRVDALTATRDGRYVYAGGTFTKVSAKGKVYNVEKVARIDVASMSIGRFDPLIRGGVVEDLQMYGPTLIIGGSFTHVRGVYRPALASVSGVNAALTNYVNYAIRGTYHPDVATKVYRIEISPRYDRMVIAGNFTRVNGHVRGHAAMIRMNSARTVLSPWYARALALRCATSRPAYIRDIDFSPDGKEFVIATTGGQYRYPRVCDAISMWPTTDSKYATPRWVDYTRNDTMHSVAHTGTIVYVAGHEKSHNHILVLNGRTVSRAKAPEVKVSGIAALHSSTGKVVRRDRFWAGRDRGEGARKLYVVPRDAYHPAGMYVGSDTEWWYNPAGERQYLRRRIAFLPMQ